MSSGITQRQVCLMQELRKLWEQHVYWTRFVIISTAADLGDLELVTKRLLRNPGDFGAALTPFYGAKFSGRFKELLTQHLLIAGVLVGAAKDGNVAKVDEARKKWYANADDIAAFLAEIGPCWSEAKWRSMLYDHLDMTEKEAVLRLGGKYGEDIAMFEQIEEEALRMADYMFCGIVRQFCLR